MPAGVATHFLDVLAADQRSARARCVFAGVLTLAMLAPAWFLYPWEGAAVHLAAVFVGAIAGVLFARSRTRRYEASIRTTWTQWMRFAASAESVAEVHRKVRGRPGRNLPYIYAGVLFCVWGLEVGLLVLAFLEDAPPQLAAPVIALNGLLAGSLLGHFLVTARWFAGFRRSVSELVDSGEIGMWGVM